MGEFKPSGQRVGPDFRLQGQRAGHSSGGTCPIGHFHVDFSGPNPIPIQHPIVSTTPASTPTRTAVADARPPVHALNGTERARS